MEKADRTIAILDIFAVGLFSAMGADKALRYGLDPLACVMMGVFTGVGGGMLRDVLGNRIPFIFLQGNFYAIASTAGATAFIALVEAWGMPKMGALIIATGVTMLLRWISLSYNIVSPTEVDLERMARPLRRIGSRVAGPVRKRAVPGRSERSLDARRGREEDEIHSRRSQEAMRRRGPSGDGRREARGGKT